MAARSDPALHRILIAVGIAAFAVLLVLAVWATRQTLLLIFGGVLLALLLRGLGDLLSTYTHLPRTAAMWIVVAILGSVLGFGGVYLSAEVTGQFDELGRSVTAMWKPIREYVNRYEWGREVLAMMGDPGIAADSVSAIGKLLAAVFGGVSGLIVSVIIGLYIAADPQLYRRGLLRLTPLRVRAHAADILDQLHETLRSWLLGTLLLMVVVGTLITLGLWAIGIPLALALGLIAFILEFIPYVGPIVAALPALLVAAGVGSREVVLVLLLYWAVQSLEGYILAPLVYQKRVHIPPMITISAQVVLGTLLGILGVIFATPLTACFMVLTQRLYVEDALGDDMTRPLQANSEPR